MLSPSIVPRGFDSDVYLVLDDFGSIGRAYREVDEQQIDRETVIRNLIRGEYNSAVRIVAFNTEEGWARDVTAEIALEIRDHDEELSPGLCDFIESELARVKRIAATQQHVVVDRAPGNEWAARCGKFIQTICLHATNVTMSDQ